jgi:TetR/AcrR family transcriptional regulator
MLEDIARNAGLSKAAVYRYFPSKQALVAAVATDEIDRAVATVDRIEALNLPPAETLAALVAAHVERLLNNLASGRVALRQLPADIPELEYFHRQRLRYWRALHSIIKRGISEGDFVPVPPWLAVEALIGMASSVIDRYSPKWPLDGRAMAQYYAYLAVHAMLTPQALLRRTAEGHEGIESFAFASLAPGVPTD